MNTTLLLESSDPSPWKTVLQNLKDIMRVVVGMPLTWCLLRKIRPDLVFLMDVTFPQCALAAFMARVPVVCQVQEQLICGRFGLRRRLIVSILKRCDRIFGITAAHVAPFLEQSRNTVRVSVIPNTVVISEGWRPSSSDALKDTEGRDIVLFCGGTNANKGFEFVLDVAHELAKHNPASLLVFAGAFNQRYRSSNAKGALTGSGRETRYLFDYVRKHALGNYVRIIGAREDILDIMAASRVLLVPHRVPHFSRPIIEAFAVKTPVVASRDAFNAELVKNGIGGFLADYGDSGAWVTAIERVIADRSLATRLTEHAIGVFRATFDPQVVETKLVDLFESMSPTASRKLSRIRGNRVNRDGASMAGETT